VCAANPSCLPACAHTTAGQSGVSLWRVPQASNAPLEKLADLPGHQEGSVRRCVCELP